MNATQLLQMPRNGEFAGYRPVREGKKRDVHSLLLIDVYALFSDVSSDVCLLTQAGNSRTSFAQERC